MTDPSTLRFDIPHPARVWNYWLGGKDNFQADRVVGDAVRARSPEIVVVAKEARKFLARAVTYLAREAGIDQFLDIGTGLPTMQNTHEVAQRINPAARIVYVDNDPMVLSHARGLLRNTTAAGVTTYVHEDVRNPDEILAAARHVLDFDKPVAIMLLGILGHAAPDFRDMLSIITTLLAGAPSGSYLVLLDGTDTSAGARAGAPLNNYTLRTFEQLQQCFDGLELVKPGVVPSPMWRPEHGAEPLRIDSCGGVGRKP